jgi:hypothetical protein
VETTHPAGTTLHDLDFCMALQAIHETLAHGRLLTPYEQFALKVLGGSRQSGKE